MLAFGLYMGFVMAGKPVFVFTLLGASVALFAVGLYLLWKLRAYRNAAPDKAELQPEATTEPPPDVKTGPPPEAKTETQVDVNAGPLIWPPQNGHHEVCYFDVVEDV